MAFHFMAPVKRGDPNHVSKSWDDPPSIGDDILPSYIGTLIKHYKDRY